MDDRIDETLVLTGTTSTLQVGSSFTFEARYLNNVGQEEPATVLWESSDDTVASINENGLVTALAAGNTQITATVLGNDLVVTDTASLNVVAGMVQDPMLIVKTGSIMTTSSYDLSGDYTIEEVENTPGVRLTFASNYVADTALPGLYLYLTNNPNSIAGAYNAGPVTTFNGAHSLDLSDVQINDYQYLLYWCDPFGVKVGQGTAN